MLSLSKTRMIIVALVTLASIWFTIPTARYYLVLAEKPAIKGVQPNADAPPPTTDQVAYETWRQENPEAAQWRDDNAPFLEWEAEAESLRLKAIPLGLDLIGGVDVTLAIDEKQTVKTELLSIIDSLKSEFDKAQISIQPPAITGSGDAFILKLMDPANARATANILSGFQGRIQPIVSAAELEAGAVSLTVNRDYITRTMHDNVEGVRKSIADRVDKLGVTQPRISIQGGDRIRVQVPGEKDPDRLIKTVIQPAQLEFRLVDDRQDQVFNSDGTRKSDAMVPAGTEILPIKTAAFNEATRKVEYRQGEILVSSHPELTGKDLQRASVLFNPTDIANPIQVSIEFKADAAKRFADVTSKHIGKQLAIILDGEVRSHPVLRVPINDGRASIEGGFTNEEANELTQILKAGSLPAPLSIESKRAVGATVGEESIKDGVRALAYGALMVSVIMIFYYGTAGIISVLALMLNILIVLAIMSLSKATLTLSGIGGLLLTIGMAVDANILIYERIREELASGRSLKQAISLGFNRAFGVILDANLTTLLSAIVLLQFTDGSVFGFALTMTFGLLANLFTGLTVTFTLCAAWALWRGSLSVGKFHLLHSPNINFIGFRKPTWVFSIALTIALIAVVIGRGGLDYGVDFAGGFRVEVAFKEDVSEQQIRDALRPAGFEGNNAPSIQKITDVTTKNGYIIDLPLLEDTESGEKSVKATDSAVVEALNQGFPGDAHHIMLTSSFNAQSSQEFLQMALMVTILASLAIMVYLWFRFELVFGAAAVISLIHDLIIVLLLGCLWNVQVNLEVVAAMMVLMGFSVNDTIVIFDRIRENARAGISRDFGEVCNSAMNQTLARTLMTSGMLFFAVLVLYFIGGEGLRSFSKIYLLGTLFGTYSTHFIAAPFVYQWNKSHHNRLFMLLSSKRAKREAAKPIGVRS